MKEAKKPIEVYLNFYKRLKEFNVQINNVIDVGCYQGSWTSRLKLIYPSANYYLIDFNDKYREKLEILGTYYKEAVAQKVEEREFNISLSDASTGNSLYEENSNVKFEKEKVMTKPLKYIVPDQSYDVIKMDVQGAELEIIEGSMDLFQKTKFVQLECPVHANNIGAPLFEHYINYMANNNFKVFDCESLFINCKLMAMDIIFINTTLPKLSTLENSKIYYANGDPNDTPA